MFWKKKAKAIDDKARVELIRERLANHQSDGDRTKFDINKSDNDDTITFNSAEFKEYSVARINYDVTEWTDLTLCDTDVRTAFQDCTTGPMSNDVTDTDYWGTR